MLKKGKPVLDEREMQEMYRIEHRGLWLMYGLLCASVVVQMLLGAPLAQMAGELAVVLAVSVVMIISNARHGIWDANARPSVRGNAQTALLAGAAVAAVITAMKRNVLLGVGVGAVMSALCFVLLSVLMAYMRRRQKREDEALDELPDDE